MVCWLNSDHGNLTLDRQTPICCKRHWSDTSSNMLCHPPRASLKTGAAENQLKESRWGSVAALQTCNKKKEPRPFNDYYTPIHQHHQVHTLNWTLREERLNWQIPGEGEITSHVSKTVLIWFCAQWLQQQVPAQGSEGGEGGNMQSASK